MEFLTKSAWWAAELDLKKKWAAAFSYSPFDPNKPLNM
jgi:hypothetical protein